MKDKEWVFKTFITTSLSVLIALTGFILKEVIAQGKTDAAQAVIDNEHEKRLDRNDKRDDNQDNQISYLIKHPFIRPEDVDTKEDRR